MCKAEEAEVNGCIDGADGSKGQSLEVDSALPPILLEMLGQAMELSLACIPLVDFQGLPSALSHQFLHPPDVETGPPHAPPTEWEGHPRQHPSPGLNLPLLYHINMTNDPDAA